MVRGIISKRTQVSVTIHFPHHWETWNQSIIISSVDILLTKDRSLTVTLKDSVKFVILLHKVWAKHPYHRDYLGFYTLDSHLLSSSVHGLLGKIHTTGRRRFHCRSITTVVHFILFFFLQVSSIMVSSMRCRICVQVRSQRNQMPPCSSKGSNWTWPGMLSQCGSRVDFSNHLLLKYHLFCPQRLAERFQEWCEERRKCTLLVHS